MTLNPMETIRNIRRRTWYRRWEHLYKFMDGRCGRVHIPNVLREVHKLINGAHGYGTNTIAGSSKDSLEQLLKDKEA